MKFWRRHKHELDWEVGDEPLPPPPDKKLRYSRDDDILLARYFLDRPDGTSDKVFQAFGRSVSLLYNATFLRVLIPLTAPSPSMERLARASSDP